VKEGLRENSLSRRTAGIDRFWDASSQNRTGAAAHPQKARQLIGYRTSPEGYDPELSGITFRWQIEATVQINPTNKHKDADVISGGAPVAIASTTRNLEFLTWREALRGARAAKFCPSAAGYGHDNNRYVHGPDPLVAAVADFQRAAKLLRVLLMRNGHELIFEISSKNFNGRIWLLDNVNQGRDIVGAGNRGFRFRRRDCEPA
jgi:hypothetical protein